MKYTHVYVLVGKINILQKQAVNFKIDFYFMPEFDQQFTQGLQVQVEILMCAQFF